MASAIPVLPLVGSRMVAPGRSRPSASATRTMLSAARSLIEPVGLRSSSLAQRRTDGLGARLGRPTSGVWPTESAREAYRVIGFGVRRVGQPPATAGSTTTTSPSAVGALSPPLNRTSSSLT